MYTETSIAGCLARTLFKSDLVVVDRCNALGNECDLLVVTPRLQAIDVEVKISRADLKADRKKDKWFGHSTTERETGVDARGYRYSGWKKLPLEWPQRVWKHYYALPAQLWKPEYLELCQARSGVILVDAQRPAVGWGAHYRAAPAEPRYWYHEVVRRATPRPDYVPLRADMVAKIARLASLRMWDAYALAFKPAAAVCLPPEQ